MKTPCLAKTSRPVNAAKTGRVALMRRGALTGCKIMALIATLFVSTPARAGITDWWDIFAGMHEIEIKRLNLQADVTLAWHQARQLREVSDNLSLALWRLKPPQVQELVKALDDDTLDALELPPKKGDDLALTAVETRKEIGLPPKGLAFHGLAVRRCGAQMIVYYDIKARELIRFQDDARLLYTTLHRDIWKNPPVPRDTMSVDNQLGEYMPLLIANGQMKRHDGSDVSLPDQDCMEKMMAVMPQKPTIGLISARSPRRTYENVRIGNCQDGQIGDKFQTVHFINGEESDNRDDWHTCVPKPPKGESVSRTEREDGCDQRPGMIEFDIDVRGRYSSAYGFTRAGSYRRTRKHWTHTETFPKEWDLSPLVLTWVDDWIVHQDTCHIRWKTPGPPDRSTRRVIRDGLRCTQHRRRDTVRNWLQYPDNWLQYPDSGVQQAYPFVTRPRGWRNVGQPVCPVRSRSVSVEPRTIAAGNCKQKQKRQVTTHWLTYADGRRTQDNPHVTHGAWSNIGQPDCPPPPRVASNNSGGSNSGGGHGGGGEGPGTTYDTDGDGYTDSYSRQGSDHRGLQGDIGSRTSFGNRSGNFSGSSSSRGGGYGGGRGGSSGGENSGSSSGGRGGSSSGGGRGGSSSSGGRGGGYGGDHPSSGK